MLRRYLMTLLMLAVGFNPMASAWAGVGANGTANDSDSMPGMSMAAGDMQHRMQAGDTHKASHHCMLKCKGDCGSDCCASGACNTCGHCAAAALFDVALDIPVRIPALSPPFVSCSLEKGEPTPPFRPPLQTS